MATVDLLRSWTRPNLGEPRLAPELRRDKSVALIVAVAVSEVDEERGDGVSRRCRIGSMGCGEGWRARGCNGEAEVERDGGSELRSGAMTQGDCQSGHGSL